MTYKTPDELYREMSPAYDGITWDFSKIPRGKGTVSFWTSVMNEWNQSHPKNEYKNWKGAKIAYERIITKLGVDIQSAAKASMDLENESEGGTR